MIKKIAAVVGTAVLVTALGLFAVGTVFAEDPTPTPSAPTPWGGAWGRMCRGAGIISDAVTELLGMTPEEIFTERSAGKTLSQIANEKGVTDQQVIDAVLAGQQEAIDQAVADGKITQEQADWLVARAKALAPFQLSNPFAPRGGRGGWHGRMRGGPGCWGNEAPVPSETSSS
jgi:hypothetical protein